MKKSTTVKNKSTFDSIITQQQLRQLAGGRSYARGDEYFQYEYVKALAEYDDMITASVQGTHRYQVKLWIEDDELDYSCTCPVGNDGEFCKHCVAVGLAWLEQPEVHSRKKSRRTTITMDDVKKYLSKQEKKALIKMLMDQSKDDEQLRQRLLMKAAKNNPKGLDLATYKNAINDAVGTNDFVDYRSMFAYSSDIEKAIDPIEELIREGHAAESIELAEYALAAVESGMDSVDDSDGQMGEILERLQEIHHLACKKAKPDPEELAERLFAWELRAEYDVFYRAVESYADVLGEKGLAVYRRLAEAEWAKVPKLLPGRDDPEKYSKRFRITSIMEALARRTGKIEDLVAVKQRDLSNAYDFLEIAEIYKKTKKDDLALKWAEKGVAAFPKQTDSRLREFLANEYHNRHRHEEAMALMWAEFTEAARLKQFQILKKHADRVKQWPLWREKALLFLREQINKEKQKARGIWAGRVDNSALVEIYLWEKNIESAWREAMEGGCGNDLWLQLATKREKEHPEDALVIYQKQIEPTLNQKNNPAYKQAVRYLTRIHGIMARLGKETEFKRYLDAVRLAHKPKRNFMKMLENSKL